MPVRRQVKIAFRLSYQFTTFVFIIFLNSFIFNFTRSPKYFFQYYRHSHDMITNLEMNVNSFMQFLRQICHLLQISHFMWLSLLETLNNSFIIPNYIKFDHKHLTHSTPKGKKCKKSHILFCPFSCPPLNIIVPLRATLTGL